MSRIVLGLGTGQCGLNLLAEILNQQVHSDVTFEERPLLPWNPKPSWPGLRERIARWKANRKASLIGDVASFYLPHLEPILQADASIKAICLTRPQDEVVASFIQQLDRICPFPTNHWARVPAPGWFHDPLWSQCFPQYETTDRETGIARYWDDYEAATHRLAELYPQQFLRLDTEALTDRNGVRRLLEFLEIPPAAQVVVTGRKPAPKTNEPASSSEPRFPNPTDPRRCVVLVPFSGFIHQDCENALKELERRGYQVRRVAGYAAIDQGRNQMATDALLDGFDETLWIDSDIGFHPDDVDRLRAHQLPIVCGIYPQKGKRALACHVMPGAQQMTFGEQGGLTELLYAGTGFLLIRREVYLAVQRHHQLPTCNERFGHPMLPFFYPMLRPIDDGHWYLAEDYAFCERARQCGYQIWADTMIRLWHIGTYRYGWEDAGMDRPRFGTFTLNFGPPENETPNRRLSPDALANFVRAYPWPAEKPDVPQPPHRNWFYPAVQKALAETMPKDAQLVVEIGSWLGRSTRYLTEIAPRAKVIAIDHWQGSPEHQQDPELAPLLPHLYETFLAENWDYRERIIPVRLPSVDGLRTVAQSGLVPDLIYIDGDHSAEAVRADLQTTLDLFPTARIVGDDWDWPGVKQAVEQLARERQLKIEVLKTAWRIQPKTKSP